MRSPDATGARDAHEETGQPRRRRLDRGVAPQALQREGPRRRARQACKAADGRPAARRRRQGGEEKEKGEAGATTMSLPPILRADYRRHVLYPRLAWFATYASLGLIGVVVLTSWR